MPQFVELAYLPDWHNNWPITKWDNEPTVTVNTSNVVFMRPHEDEGADGDGPTCRLNMSSGDHIIVYGTVKEITDILNGTF